MTREQMDKLQVGDVIMYRTYSCPRGRYVCVPATVVRLYVCSDGGCFAHGGYHSVWIRYTLDGYTWTEPADNDLVCE